MRWKIKQVIVIAIGIYLACIISNSAFAQNNLSRSSDDNSGNAKIKTGTEKQINKNSGSRVKVINKTPDGEGEENVSSAELNKTGPDKSVEETEEDTDSFETAEDAAPFEGESLFDTVKRGGKLMIFILLLGVAGLTVIIERIIYYIRNRAWKRDGLEEYLSGVADKSEAGFREELEDELRDAFQLYVNRMERGMAFLNGIGNISPIVGFLGTVIGMISAFAAIAAATTVNAKVVAVGIQIALITTAGGLTVAAPVLAFFHLFNHLIQSTYSYADEIISKMVSGLPSILHGNTDI